jgi:hypothetical protein
MHNRQLIAALASLVGLLAGCTATASPTPTPSAVVSTSNLGKLGPGDCLGSLDGGSFDLAEVQPTSCTAAHNWEVSEVVPLSGEPYPGQIDLKQKADDACASAFTSYLGAQPNYSRYAVSYLVPDEAAWADQTSRRVVCLVGSSGEPLSASIKGDATLFPEIGQCTQAGTTDSTVPQVVPCSQEHQYEAYAEKKWTGSAAPTTAEADKLYTDVCVAAFTTFIGIDVGRSTYEISAFLAPADAWTQIADHRIVCAVGSAAGGITGSLKGVKK